MQRSLFVLSASLLIILGTLIALSWSREKPKDLGVETPKGVPPSQRPRVEKPRVEPHQEAPESTIATESVQTQPLESEWAFANLKARVTWGGQPLSGAWMVAQPITIRPDTGHRDTLSLFDFSDLEYGQRSNQDGGVGKKVRYPADISGDSLFGVAIFHRERGTAYDEISINDLAAGRILELEPELGEIVVGRVLGKNGEPIPNARVHINTETPHDAVCLSGLGARSGPDGSFMIPGLRFENKLRTVWATEASREFHIEDGTVIEAYGATQRIVDRETDFSPQENTWTIGDISVATKKSATDLTTGEVTTLPSDE